jgi:GTP-binding protein Era
MAHKSGFVNIIGNPNVGKSTLMNALVGTRLSIISPKAQTTRHRIQGIVNGENYQIVYSDTPGILSPKYRLQELMLKMVRSALNDADILLYVTDVSETPVVDEFILNSLKKMKIPLIVVINKVDRSNQPQVEKLIREWGMVLPSAIIIPVSATEGFNLDGLFRHIMENLREGPAFYPKDELTDKPEKFFAAEILREKVFYHYREEIPYSIEVEIESFKAEPRLTKIRAVIFVEKDTQKGIIIGNKGEAIKRTGTDARLEMEKFFGRRVFLEILVRVRRDWRNNESILRSFGYQ